jgi:hypothetical protein
MTTANPMSRIFAASTTRIDYLYKSATSKQDLRSQTTVQSNVANQKPGTSGFNTIALENETAACKNKQNTKIMNRTK